MKKKKPRPAARKSRPTLWVIDPWETLDHAKDTTLRLIDEGLKLGQEHWICDVRRIALQSARVTVGARRVVAVAAARGPGDFTLDPLESLAPTAFRQIHWRVDPPVNLAWIHPLQILDFGLRGARGTELATELVNPAAMLFAGNEKLEPAALGALMPESVVSAHWETLAAFGQRQGRVVMKPLHQAQSKGIELLDFAKDAAGARRSIESASNRLAQPILLQRYLPGIADGETRVWYVDGKLIGAIRKYPVKGDFRVNMDGGSRLGPATLTPAERKTAGAIARQLRARKIRLAAIDVIDAYVTDFNFTSPGLIPQMEQVLGKNLARVIMRALAR